MVVLISSNIFVAVGIGIAILAMSETYSRPRDVSGMICSTIMLLAFIAYAVIFNIFYFMFTAGAL